MFHKIFPGLRRFFAFTLPSSLLLGCSVFESEACKRAKEQVGAYRLGELKHERKAALYADSYDAARKELEELREYMQTKEYKIAAKKSKNLDKLVNEKLSRLEVKVDNAKMDVHDHSGGSWSSYNLSGAQEIKKQACGY